MLYYFFAKLRFINMENTSINYLNCLFRVERIGKFKFRKLVDRNMVLDGWLFDVYFEDWEYFFSI